MSLDLFSFFQLGDGIPDCSDGSDESSGNVKWWMLAIAVLVLSGLAIFTSFATRIIADQVRRKQHKLGFYVKWFAISLSQYLTASLEWSFGLLLLSLF